jgi:hypothetical protein
MTGDTELAEFGIDDSNSDNGGEEATSASGCPTCADSSDNRVIECPSKDPTDVRVSASQTIGYVCAKGKASHFQSSRTLRRVFGKVYSSGGSTIPINVPNDAIEGQVESPDQPAPWKFVNMREIWGAACGTNSYPINWVAIWYEWDNFDVTLETIAVRGKCWSGTECPGGDDGDNVLVHIAPHVWAVVAEGFRGAEVEAFNGKRELNLTSGEPPFAVWRSETDERRTNVEMRCELPAAIAWEISFNSDAAKVVYTITAKDFNPLGANVLERISSSTGVNEGSSLPAKIHAVPA